MGGGEADSRRNQCQFRAQDDLEMGKDFGQIQGRAFMDRDENGLHDDTEEPLAGVRFRLDGVEYATTDKGGLFVYDDLAPGLYGVAVDHGSLKKTWTAVTPLAVSAKVTARATTHVRFGFNQYKEVLAVVYDDRNQNGQRDPDEPGVHAVRVNIKDTDFHAYSARDGFVRIKRIPVGTP